MRVSAVMFPLLMLACTPGPDAPRLDAGASSTDSVPPFQLRQLQSHSVPGPGLSGHLASQVKWAKTYRTDPKLQTNLSMTFDSVQTSFLFITI